MVIVYCGLFFQKMRVLFMQSDGGLTPVSSYVLL